MIWLGLFVAVAGLSLIMPVWLDSHIVIPPEELLGGHSTLLHLKSRNITSFLYVLFGYLFVYITVILNQTILMYRKTLKAFMAGSAFAALWGLFEFFCKSTGIGFPGQLLNTSTNPVSHGYLQRSEAVFRLSSVAVEPSVLAQTLLIPLCLGLPFALGKFTLFGKRADRLLLCSVFAVLCLSTSSLAYVGIALILVMILVMFAMKGILRLKHLILPAAIIALAWLLNNFVPIVHRVLFISVFSKSDSYSAIERFRTIQNSYVMFLGHPMLGIGWASIASHDVVINLLANAGVFALLFFAIAMYSMFAGLYRTLKQKGRHLHAEHLLRMDFAAYLALAVLLATSELNGIIYEFTFFWFVFGLAIATSGLAGTDSLLSATSDSQPQCIA